MILILDYGMGNSFSIKNMLYRVGLDSLISNNIDEINKAEKIIMPGVGAFDAAIENIEKLGIRKILYKKAKIEKIPILGINAGRLGFLTSIKKDTLEEGLDLFFEGKYTNIKRSLLEVSTEKPVDTLEHFRYALNEVSINRKNTTSLLSIDAKLDDQFLTTYWADGLIIATPTGSPGYSLSSGGPIVSPSSECLIVNPIAPHNINMRPLIVPDKTIFEVSVKGRGKNYLLSLDSRILTIENGNDIFIKKAKFNAITVQLDGTFFFNTLREKLFWGHDSRNIQ